MGVRSGPGPGAGRRGRLSRSAEFDRVYRRGKARSNRHLVLHAFERPEGGEDPRVGISVSRKVGGAVERNRVKRVLREALREQGPRLPSGSDYVISARPSAGELADREGLPGVHAALAELVEAALAGTGQPRAASEGER